MAGLSTLDKTAAIFGKNGLGGLLENPVIGTVAAAVALEGISAATSAISEFKDKRKFNNVIDYAKKAHPELRDVPQSKLLQQMNAFYTLAPSVSTNKELGASMLATTNDYGGSVDLATAKLISDIGGKQKGGHRDAVLAAIGTGRSVVKRER